MKTGGDIVHLEYDQNVSRSGIDYLDNAGNILRTITFTGPGHLGRANYESALYAQDSWRVRPWLLVEAGFFTSFNIESIGSDRNEYILIAAVLFGNKPLQGIHSSFNHPMVVTSPAC